METCWGCTGAHKKENPDHGEAVLMEATSYEPHYGSLETTLTVSQRLFVTSKQKRLTEILQLLQDVVVEAPTLSPEAVSKLHLAVERLRKTIISAAVDSALPHSPRLVSTSTSPSPSIATSTQPIPIPTITTAVPSHNQSDCDEPPEGSPPPPPVYWDVDRSGGLLFSNEMSSAGGILTRAATTRGTLRRQTLGERWNKEMEKLRSKLHLPDGSQSEDEGGMQTESMLPESLDPGSETDDEDEDSTWEQYEKAGGRSRSKNVEAPIKRAHSDSMTLAYRSRVEIEIIESEEVYIATLRLLNGHYITPLIDTALFKDLFKDANDRDTVVALRSNLVSLIEFNSILLDRLIIRQSTPRQNRSPEDAIGRIFLEMAPKMITYKDYHYRHQETMDCLERLMTNPPIADLITSTREILAKKRAHTDANCDMWNMLITPVQRIPRYQLLLQELLKYTPRGDQDAIYIKEALSELRRIAEEIDSASGDMRKKLREIQESMSGDVMNLLDTQREFVMEGTLIASIDSLKCREYQFFLFSDVLLYATKKKLAIVNPLITKKPSLRYKGFFLLSNLAYADIPDQPEKQLENAFGLVCTDSGKSKRVLLMAKNHDEKKMWMKNLSHFIPLSEEPSVPKLVASGDSLLIQRKLTGFGNREETTQGEVTCKERSLSMQGFMNKRGEINKSWKRRYFKLNRNELLYFEGPSMTKLRGKILLPSFMLQLSYDPKSKLPFCLKLQPTAKASGVRSYLLEPETSQQLYQWIRALRRHVAKVDDKVRDWQLENSKELALASKAPNVSS